MVEGQTVPQVKFDAWQTRWPQDGTDLADKTIVIYTPEQQGLYPSYFPYWLEISGLSSYPKVRIIDSGSNLASPVSLQETL